MHSRVFVINDVNPDYEDVDTDIDFETFQIFCSSADYLDESDNFDSDAEWFAESYGVEIQKNDNGYSFDLTPFMAKLEVTRIARIEQAKEILNSKPAEDIDDIDLWRAIDYLESKTGFLFYLNGNLYTEMDLIGCLNDYYPSENKPKFEILKIYDYHF